MSLCDLCQKIPWENLPTVPEHLGGNRTGVSNIHIIIDWPRGVSGYSHHQSLEALYASALSCALCGLMRNSAENVQRDLQEHNEKYEGKGFKYDSPTWQLFIVKRREGGDGIWVMSFVSGESARVERRKERGTEEAWIIAAIGLCTRESDPLQSVFEGRPVEEDATSPACFARARRWLQECDQHDSCMPPSKVLPSRIIDVGELEAPQVHLVEISDGTTGDYVSLSYCWGDSEQFTTTRATMEERKKGIVIADMPATYRDIVRLTRELGLRYLWLDALCICQDEHSDWERESAKMLSIYSNAYLTVSASRAKDIAEGFLGTRGERTFVELNYTRDGISGKVLAFSLSLREEHIKLDYVTLPKEPLNKRAWALQERMLSHRVLVCGSKQMFFECVKGYRGEDGLRLDIRHESVLKPLKRSHDFKNNIRFKDLALNDKPEGDPLRSWYDILWQYGPKKLTRATDKLPALSGIAKVYAETIQEEYLAGLWRNQLHEGLVWQGLKFRRVPEYRAPSWSWASGDGIGAAGQILQWAKIAEILDAQVTLKGSNPFGEVTGGWIKLRAPLEPLHLMLDDWDPEGPVGRHLVKLRTDNGDKAGMRSGFDYAYTADDAPQEGRRIIKSLEGVKIFALVILKSASWEPNGTLENGSYHSLIVKKVEGTDNYERLGYTIGNKNIMGHVYEEENSEAFPIVTIV